MKMPELGNAGLDGLRSFDQLKLVNAIDSLRSSGIDHYVSLPQIIVCGDQSSGKSSVLEAISGVPFPVKSTICTRFPIELVLRNAPIEALEVRIVPHQSRSENDKRSLRAFNKRLENFSDLPELINTAKSAMTALSPGMSFSRDILSIEIHGPDRPHLTIVDLPGLIHSETKNQSVEDVTLIQEVVQGYMKEERTIILAVVSAKYEYSNQIILRLSRTIDPRGRRTLGIITKPDTLLEGSESEQKFILLAKNQDIEFRLGWHVLRNLDSEVANYSLEHRNAKEEYFFSRGNWASLPPSSLGVKTLRSRLSKLLVQQIAIELPALVAEIETKTSLCLSQLDQMGKPRNTMDEKRVYLIQVSQSFQRLVTAAAEGTYSDKFFGDATTGFDKRLRAVIQKLSISFATKLRRSGREYIIGPQIKKVVSTPRVVSREDLCKEVMDLAEKTRGRELPGLLNPMIISDLFRKLCSPWRGIASAHIEKVWDATRTFLNYAVNAVTEIETAEAIMNVIVRPQLAQIHERIHTKLDELLQPHQESHPITYRDSFEELFRDHCISREELSRAIEEKLNRHMGTEELSSNFYFTNSIDMNALHKDLLNIYPSGPRIACYDANNVIDTVDKYYEIALGRLIDDIAVQVIESNLVAVLGQILEPLTIVKMTEGEINEIADETEKTRETRELLQKQLETLKKGAEIFQKYQKSNIFTMAGELQKMMEVDSLLASGTPDTEGEFSANCAEVNNALEELNAMGPRGLVGNDEEARLEAEEEARAEAQARQIDEEEKELAKLERKRIKRGGNLRSPHLERYILLKSRVEERAETKGVVEAGSY